MIFTTRRGHCGRFLAVWAATACAPPALAQYGDSVSVTVEAASEERRRGLSWSDGNPVIRLAATAPLAEGLSLDASATSLWGSRRHDGADAIVDVGPSYMHQLGPWRLSVEGQYHLFPGAGGEAFGEIGARAEYALGPVNLGVFGSYAPSQSSIGGSNLYLSASAATGIPGTPFTISTHLARSSGDVSDPVRAARLRPSDTYWDHGAAIAYYKGRLVAGLRYSGSSIDGPGRRHGGAALIARIGLLL